MLLLGDCLDRLPELEAGSVDLILCDPPYGTAGGMGAGEARYARLAGSVAWDVALTPADFLPECNRVLRTNGCLILFSQEPYTSRLITEAHGNLPFSYRMAWLKDHFANSLLVNKAPVSYFEDVLVFRCKKGIDTNHDFDGKHPLRDYAALVLRHCGGNRKSVHERLGHQGADHFFRVGSSQFQLCTRATYDQLVCAYGLADMPGFREFDGLKAEDVEFKAANAEKRRAYLEQVAADYPVVFNLRRGEKFKSNLLTYRKDRGGYHPTQKPVALLADLIETYSNPGDTVLDFTMGSGSTGVACVHTGRRFIGIEQKPEYFATAERRIAEARLPLMEAAE